MTSPRRSAYEPWGVNGSQSYGLRYGMLTVAISPWSAKYNVAAGSLIRNWTRFSAIHDGERTNHLRIELRGRQLRLVINGEALEPLEIQTCRQRRWD